MELAIPLIPLVSGCAVLLALRLLSQWLLCRLAARRHGCGAVPAYPQQALRFGSDVLAAMAMGKASGRQTAFMQDLFRRHGDTFQTTVWGQRWLYTCDPANIRAMNTGDGAACFGVQGIRKPAGHGWIGDGIFVSDGDRWRASKALLKPLFARAHISDFTSLRVHVERALNTIPGDGQTIDLQPLFKRMYLDISFDYLFGKSPDTLLSGSKQIDADGFHRNFEIAMVGMSQRTALGRALIASSGDAEYEKACAYVHSVFDGYIDAAIKQWEAEKELPRGDSEKFPSMLQELVQVTQDRQFLRDQLLNVFIGAKDTAALGIGHFFFNMARYPGVWQKLRAEILEIREPVTFELLKSMKYLQQALRESLRLLSPVDRSNRLCIKDCVLPRGGGPDGQQPIYIRKGDRIESRFGAIHRDPRIWGPDAEELRPERWDDMLTRWDYIPFMGGLRMCPAQQMTLTQYGYIVVRFAQAFTAVENRDSVSEFVEEIKFSKQSKNGVKISFVRAKDGKDNR